MLSVVVLSVFMVNAFMLNVVAPFEGLLLIKSKASLNRNFG
jgi:hypothetical protein